jgi:hypothetical protein
MCIPWFGHAGSVPELPSMRCTNVCVFDLWYDIPLGVLDSKMNPKITNFRTAKTLNEMITLADNIEGAVAWAHDVINLFFVSLWRSFNLIQSFRGYIYMPPEYVLEGITLVKYDVYSFGIIYLEIYSHRERRAFHVPGTSFRGLERGTCVQSSKPTPKFLPFAIRPSRTHAALIHSPSRKRDAQSVGDCRSFFNR